ncbi:MAG: XrtB/PEP-CTERM-associated polysaccharide biosynthesis outer membrane protein EpsL [Thiobacillus sp.]
MAVLVNRAVWLRAFLLGQAGLLLSFSVLAKEGDTFRPFVSMGQFYDSNLFRLAENESPGTQRDELFRQFNVGMGIDWRLGRQQLTASLAKTLIRYDQNTRLDFDGDDMQATWNWRLGNRLSGNLGASQSTSQSSFNDLGTANISAGNNVERDRKYGQLNWEFHPRWQVFAGTETSDSLNSAQTQVSQNVSQNSHNVGLSYRTPKGSSLRARFQRTNADYAAQQILGVRQIFIFTIVDVADNSFQQNDYSLEGDWRLFGKLSLRGQVSKTERKYANELKDPLGGSAQLVARPDFSGLTGRLTGDWSASGKTQFSASIYQELGTTSDINASSVLTQGASMSGVWLPRAKWRMNVSAALENRDYRGNPGSTQRNDDTLSTSVSLGYTPMNALSLSLGAQAGWRDSSDSVENYQFYGLSFNVRGDF